MEHIRQFCDQASRQAPKDKPVPNALRAALDAPGIYSRSLERHGDLFFFLARTEDNRKVLVLYGTDSTAESFDGERVAPDLRICERTGHNAALLRELFPYTAPRSLAEERCTFGTGDRLGVATPGHIMAIEPFDAVPVLAQQSRRELALCGGRTFLDVIDCATWGVFERHFTRGFGADGDHVKNAEEVESALAQGATMITLDASEHIDNDVLGLSAGQVRDRYLELPPRVRKPYEKRYLDRRWDVRDATGGRHTIEFDDERLARSVLIYHRMIEFASEVFRSLLHHRSVDFEVSIDETLTSTDPGAHFLIANELAQSGVAVWSMAPRFCGEFQKGIDYIGDVGQFEAEFAVHAAIADKFGYKLSIHSGSDKFTVFPIIGKYTDGRLHHKTAGTSWLEAMRLVATKEPTLFREMYAYALEHFDETRPYYHVNAEPEYCPAPGKLADADLPTLLDQDDPRQVIHTTYGVLLQARGAQGFLFRDRFYAVLDRYESEHYALLARHIGRHLHKLNIEEI